MIQVFQCLVQDIVDLLIAFFGEKHGPLLLRFAGDECLVFLSKLASLRGPELLCLTPQGKEVLLLHSLQVVGAVGVSDRREEDVGLVEPHIGNIHLSGPPVDDVLHFGDVSLGPGLYSVCPIDEAVQELLLRILSGF